MQLLANTYRHAYRLLIGGLLISWVVVCCVSAYSLYSSRQQVQHNAEIAVGNLTLSLENYLRTHFAVAELILQQAAQEYRVGTGKSFNSTSFSNALVGLQKLLPNNTGVRGANENGDVIYGSGLPTGKTLSVAQRRFFTEAKHSGALVFGLPLKSRVTDSWVLPMALPLRKADGSFGGVVYLNTDVNAFATLFESVKVGQFGSVALFDAERRVYLRVPPPPETMDEEVIRFGSPEIRNALASGDASAVFQATSSVDGEKRTSGFRKIGNYPLYVLVGLGKDEYLADWYMDVRNHVFFLLLLAIAEVILATALKRSWRYREEALRQILLKDKELEISLKALTVSQAELEQRSVALAVARDSAEAASRAKSTFLANMSHELRTPMNAIMGMTNIALRHADDPQLRDQLGKIDQASRHLLAVINDILDISKIEAERMTLEQVDFKLAQVLENLTSMFGHKAQEKGLKFCMDLPPDLAALPLKGDPLRLGQILLNLIGNALKFTEAGTITLRVRPIEETAHDLRLRFEVEDSGIGISSADQQRLFTAFQQADGSMTRKYGGTGLGLAISKRLAMLMGGDIGVVSQPGVGSTFSLTVRFEKAHPAANGAVPPAPTLSRQKADERLLDKFAGTRVLLAEDEPINQEVSRGLLEDAGLVVDIAEDGAIAVERARENRYALILMDMQMPNLNGVDATLAIRKLPGYATTPILAMTANAFDEDRQRCIEAGMNDHIAKPVDPDKLYQTLLKWLSATNIAN